MEFALLIRPMTRRRFVSSSLAVATTLELQQAARALGVTGGVDVCRLQAEQEVGPYCVPDELRRTTIHEDRAGLPLTLRLVLLNSRTCRPLPNAAVDLWHCDALGLYSGFTAMNPSGPGPGGPPPPGFDPQHPGNRPGPPEHSGPPPINHPTDKLTFCRGIQLTDPTGSVSFSTIFPGFYMGRTNHIHFKVRLGGSDAGPGYTGGHTSHVGQVFFPEAMAAELMQHEPYSRHKIHRTTQQEDDIFEHQGGRNAVATLHLANPADRSKGYSAELIATVDPNATPKPVRPMGPPPGGPPPDRP